MSPNHSSPILAILPTQVSARLHQNHSGIPWSWFVSSTEGKSSTSNYNSSIVIVMGQDFIKPLKCGNNIHLDDFPSNAIELYCICDGSQPPPKETIHWIIGLLEMFDYILLTRSRGRRNWISESQKVPWPALWIWFIPPRLGHLVKELQKNKKL